MSATTDKAPLYEAARESVRGVLASREVPKELLGEGESGSLLWHAAFQLISTAKDLDAHMESLTREFESAKRYTRGESAAFNSLGIVQGRGSRIDVLCAVLDQQVQRYLEAHVSHALAWADAFAK